MTEVRQHHGLSGRESKQTPGDDEGQESLACCSPWGRKESDTTERLNNNKSETHCSPGFLSVCVEESNPQRQCCCFPFLSLILLAPGGQSPRNQIIPDFLRMSCHHLSYYPSQTTFLLYNLPSLSVLLPTIPLTRPHGFSIGQSELFQNENWILSCSLFKTFDYLLVTLVFEEPQYCFPDVCVLSCFSRV